MCKRERHQLTQPVHSASSMKVEDAPPTAPLGDMQSDHRKQECTADDCADYNKFIAMLEEEGLDNVFSRHKRLADSCRAAVDAWELETICLNPREHSNALTGIMMPDGHDADYVRQVILEHFNGLVLCVCLRAASSCNYQLYRTGRIY